MTSFKFWHTWLLAVSILNILMGMAIALAPDSFLFTLHTAALADTFFGGALPDGAAALRRFTFGIIGGTLAGYFLLQTLIVWIPFKRREPWAWHAVLWALLVWFVLDSGMSIYHGAYFNVWMINLPSLLLIGLPLVMTRGVFRATNKAASRPL